MNKKSFTLIELLVVIAIIGVVAALFVPALGKARKSVRRAMCANNLRQIGIALHLYIDDHNYKLPDRGGYAEDSWMNDISVYFDNNNLWNCPDYKNSLPFDIYKASYGYNFRGLTTNPDSPIPSISGLGKDFNSIRNFSNCIMIADSYNGIFLIAISDLPPGNRHSGGANVLFVDGHIGWYLPSFLVSQGIEWWNYE